MEENGNAAEEKRAKKAKKAEKKRRLLFPANKKGQHIMHLMNLLRVLFVPIHFLVYPYKLYGHKKVGLGPCIYMGNHYCIWDVFYPARTTWEGVHFLMKESLMHVPILGYWARILGGIPAMRDGKDVRAVMDCIKVLKNGEKLSTKRGTERPFCPSTAGRRSSPSRRNRPSFPSSSATNRGFGTSPTWCSANPSN